MIRRAIVQDFLAIRKKINVIRITHHGLQFYMRITRDITCGSLICNEMATEK